MLQLAHDILRALLSIYSSALYVKKKRSMSRILTIIQIILYKTLLDAFVYFVALILFINFILNSSLILKLGRKSNKNVYHIHFRIDCIQYYFGTCIK